MKSDYRETSYAFPLMHRPVEQTPGLLETEMYTQLKAIKKLCK